MNTKCLGYWRKVYAKLAMLEDRISGLEDVAHTPSENEGERIRQLEMVESVLKSKIDTAIKRLTALEAPAKPAPQRRDCVKCGKWYEDDGTHVCSQPIIGEMSETYVAKEVPRLVYSYCALCNDANCGLGGTMFEAKENYWVLICANCREKIDGYRQPKPAPEAVSGFEFTAKELELVNVLVDFGQHARTLHDTVNQIKRLFAAKPAPVASAATVSPTVELVCNGKAFELNGWVEHGVIRVRILPDFIRAEAIRLGLLDTVKTKVAFRLMVEELRKEINNRFDDFVAVIEESASKAGAE